MSQATSLGFFTCSSTSSWRRGSILARNTKRASRNCAGILGRKCENAEMRLERLGEIQVVPIAAAPPKRGALHLLQSREIDAALRRGLKLVDPDVGADRPRAAPA